MNALALEHLLGAFIRALEDADLLFLGKYLTADVVYIRTMPTATEVQGKERVLARMEPFLSAFSGWTFNAQDITIDEARQQVRCSLHITGSNQGAMDFRGLGQGKYAPTGKAFALPPGKLMLTVRGAEIQRIDMEFAEGGGLTGIFEQIGPHR